MTCWSFSNSVEFSIVMFQISALNSYCFVSYKKSKFEGLFSNLIYIFYIVGIKLNWVKLHVRIMRNCCHFGLKTCWQLSKSSMKHDILRNILLLTFWRIAFLVIDNIFQHDSVSLYTPFWILNNITLNVINDKVDTLTNAMIPNLFICDISVLHSTSVNICDVCYKKNHICYKANL